MREDKEKSRSIFCEYANQSYDQLWANFTFSPMPWKFRFRHENSNFKEDYCRGNLTFCRRFWRESSKCSMFGKVVLRISRVQIPVGQRPYRTLGFPLLTLPSALHVVHESSHACASISTTKRLKVASDCSLRPLGRWCVPMEGSFKSLETPPLPLFK